MKASLRVPLAWLALMAMFAAMLPQTLWSCPMSGRIAAAALVCPMAAAEKGGMPCAGSSRKCCKPVTVPISHDDNSPFHPAFTATDSAPNALILAAPTFQLAPFAFSAPQASLAPAERVYLARSTHSPPLFRTQFRPSALAGRAPPVL